MTNIETRDAYGNALPPDQIPEDQCPAHLLPLLQELKQALVEHQDIKAAICDYREQMVKAQNDIAQASENRTKALGGPRSFHSLWKTEIAKIEAPHPDNSAALAEHDGFVGRLENGLAELRSLHQTMMHKRMLHETKLESLHRQWQSGQPLIHRHDLIKHVSASDRAHKQALKDRGLPADYVAKPTPGPSVLDQFRSAQRAGSNPAFDGKGGRRGPDGARAYPAGQRGAKVPSDR